MLGRPGVADSTRGRCAGRVKDGASLVGGGGGRREMGMGGLGLGTGTRLTRNVCRYIYYPSFLALAYVYIPYTPSED